MAIKPATREPDTKPIIWVGSELSTVRLYVGPGSFRVFGPSGQPGHKPFQNGLELGPFLNGLELGPFLNGLELDPFSKTIAKITLSFT